MPKYRVIGRSFQVGRRPQDSYFGPVIASREAMYLIVVKSHLEAHAISMTGLVGAAIIAAIGGFGGSRDIAEFDYADLPAGIRDDPEWPVRIGSARVVVIPRSVVQRIRDSFFGTFDLECESQSYAIALSIVRRFKTLEFLRENGWEPTEPALPVFVQLAPFIGLIAGVLLGVVVDAARGVRINSVELMPIGTMVGVVAGFLSGIAVYYIRSQRPAA